LPLVRRGHSLEDFCQECRRIFFYFLHFFSYRNTIMFYAGDFVFSVAELLSCTRHSSGSMYDAGCEAAEAFRRPPPRCPMVDLQCSEASDTWSSCHFVTLSLCHFVTRSSTWQYSLPQKSYRTIPCPIVKVYRVHVS
jgi:hypothetical protein